MVCVKWHLFYIMHLRPPPLRGAYPSMNLPSYLKLFKTRLAYIKISNIVTDPFRDYAPNLEKYKVVQDLSIYEARNKQVAKFCIILFLKLRIF